MAGNRWMRIKTSLDGVICQRTGPLKFDWKQKVIPGSQLRKSNEYSFSNHFTSRNFWVKIIAKTVLIDWRMWITSRKLLTSKAKRIESNKSLSCLRRSKNLYIASSKGAWFCESRSRSAKWPEAIFVLERRRLSLACREHKHFLLFGECLAWIRWSKDGWYWLLPSHSLTIRCNDFVFGFANYATNWLCKSISAINWTVRL